MLLYLSKREMPYVATVKDSRLNLDSECLRSSADTLQNEVRRAGESLEGRQYSLSVEASNASCEIVSACASNTDEVGKYLLRLQSHVDEYMRCKYRG